MILDTANSLTRCMYMQVYLGNLETHDAEGFYAAPAPYDQWGASECLFGAATRRLLAAWRGWYT